MVADIVGYPEGGEFPAVVAHTRRRIAQPVNNPLHRLAHSLLGCAAPSGFDRPGAGGQVGEVLPLRLIQLQCLSQRVQDALRDAAEVSAFPLRVIVDAHAREHCPFLAMQPGHPLVVTVGGQLGLGRGDLPRREVRNALIS